MKNKVNLYVDIINRIAEQSECKSRQVGAIIVKNDCVFGEGWNSPPKKCEASECARCSSPDHVSGKDLNLALCAHAESNLIAMCAKEGRSTDQAQLWCTTKPCAECAKLIVRSGIDEVYYLNDYESPLTDKIFKNGEVFCVKISSYFGLQVV